MFMQASEWDRYGELTLAQEEALAEIKTWSANVTTFPDHIVDDGDDAENYAERKLTHEDILSPKETSTRRAEEGALSRTDEVVLHNTAEFYKWYSELEALRTSKSEKKHQRHVKYLDERIAVCNELLGTIDEVLEIFQSLKDGQHVISERTEALRDTCDKLVAERESMVAMSEAIGERLCHFERLETLSAMFHGPLSTSSDPEEILKGLADLDLSLKFMAEHPEYLDSLKYLTKFKQLQSRAFSLVKSYFQASVEQAAKACNEVDRDKEEVDGKDSSNIDMSVAEMTLQNIRFRAVAEPRLKKLMSGIQRQAAESQAYKALLQECGKIYSKVRFEMIRSNILGEVQKIDAKSSALEALQQGAEVLSSAAEIEIQLSPQIFSEHTDDTTRILLEPLFDLMSNLLCLIVEPMIYASKTKDIEALSTINAAVNGFIHGQLSSRIFDVNSMKKLQSDVQQLIVSQAKNIAREDFKIFNPSRDDVNIISDEQRSAIQAAIESNTGQKPELYLSQARYMPVSNGIKLIETIHPALTKEQFAVLAQEIFPSLLTSISRGTEVCNDAFGELEGSLFALQQFTLLNNCISSFETDFKTNASKSGLSQLGSSIKQNITRRIPLLSSFSKPSPADIDIEEEVSKKLKTATEFAVLSCAESFVNPILSFLTKVTAAKISSDGKSIKSLAFATVERVALLSTLMSEALGHHLFKAIFILRATIPEPTLTTALGAMKENVFEAYDQLSGIVDEVYDDQERMAIKLPPRDDITSIFE